MGLAQQYPDAILKRIQKATTEHDYISWAHAVKDIQREHDFEPLKVEGRIPKDLYGTLYLNGPGFFSHFGKPYKYWPDGDGAVTAVRIHDGQATGAVKILENKGLKEERLKGKPLYGSVGTAPSSWLDNLSKKYKNPANTNILHFANRLFALYEAGLPTEFDPNTLEIIGETDFEGVIPERFSAHPHYIPTRKATYNFGIEYGLKSKLIVYEMKESTIKRMVEIPLEFAPINHDFIATANHLIFFIPPLKLKITNMLFGLGSVMDNLNWKEELGTEVIIVPIDRPAQFTRFTVDAFFQWHFANAFEKGNDIYVDFVRYSRFNMVGKVDVTKQKWGSDNGQRGYYHRSIINTQAKTIKHEQLWHNKCELPTIISGYEGLENPNVYLGSFSCELMKKEGAVDELVNLNTRTGNVVDAFSFGFNTTFAEAVFVEKKNAARKDDGYLLTLTYDANKDCSSLVIFDARDLCGGPLARLWFDHHIPPSFHGKWIDAISI